MRLRREMGHVTEPRLELRLWDVPHRYLTEGGSRLEKMPIVGKCTRECDHRARALGEHCAWEQASLFRRRGKLPSSVRITARSSWPTPSSGGRKSRGLGCSTSSWDLPGRTSTHRR